MQPAETSGMTFLVASHSFLIAVELDAAWQVRHHYVINEGHHYGLALFDDAAKILAVLDRTTLECIAWVDLNVADLPHSIGNINEVRCLSHPERAQTGHALLDIDWAQMELAKSNPLRYAAARGRIFTWAAGKGVNRMLRKRRQAAVELGE